MGTVVKCTLRGIPEQIRKIPADLPIVQIDQSEPLDTRRIDQVATARERIHFREGRGVPTPIVAGGDGTDADLQRGIDGVDQGRFPYAGVARKQRNFPGKPLLEGIYTDVLCCDRFDQLVSGRPVDLNEAFFLFDLLVGGVEVAFVEQQRYGDVVRFRRNQKPVDEFAVGGTRLQLCDKKCVINVWCYDVRLLGEVRSPADDVVASGKDIRDDPCLLLLEFVADPVADHDRIGRPFALQPKVPADAAGDRFVRRVVAQGVPTTCTFDN